MKNIVNKKLDLGLAYFGGSPTVFTRNVQRNGDWATVCFLSGTRGQSIQDNDKILIDLYSDFNSTSNLEQVKDFLKGINNTIEFANDQPTGSFLDPKLVLKTVNESSKLMSFEQDAILNKKDILHRIYVSAIRTNKQNDLPHEFKYEWENGSMYPLLQVYQAVCKLIQFNPLNDKDPMYRVFFGLDFKVLVFQDRSMNQRMLL